MLTVAIWWQMGRPKDSAQIPEEPALSEPEPQRSIDHRTASNTSESAPIFDLANPRRAAEQIANDAAELDPKNDVWHTEELTERIMALLGRLANVMKRDTVSITAGTLEAFVTEQFQCSSLDAKSREQIFADRSLKVDRMAPRGPQSSAPVTLNGAVGLADALSRVMQPLANADDRSVKFKVVHVETNKDSIVTRQRVHLSASTDKGSYEQNAVWQTRWAHPTAATDPVRLEMIKLVTWEQATYSNGATSGRFFQDSTQFILDGEAAYHDQLLFGIDHWLKRRDTNWVGPFGHHGLAVGDANGDQRDDLYVCQPGSLPNLLFLQNADGTADDCSSQAGVDILDNSRSALFVDLDNDGDQDLAVAISGQVLLLRNDGQAQFSIAHRPLAVHDAYSMAAADFDNDGKLDIYVCNYAGANHSRMDSPAPIPIHDATNGGAKSAVSQCHAEWAGRRLEFRRRYGEGRAEPKQQSMVICRSVAGCR